MAMVLLWVLVTGSQTVVWMEGLGGCRSIQLVVWAELRGWRTVLLHQLIQVWELLEGKGVW